MEGCQSETRHTTARCESSAQLQRKRPGSNREHPPLSEKRGAKSHLLSEVNTDRGTSVSKGESPCSCPGCLGRIFGCDLFYFSAKKCKKEHIHRNRQQRENRRSGWGGWGEEPHVPHWALECPPVVGTHFSPHLWTLPAARRWARGSIWPWGAGRGSLAGSHRAASTQGT